MHVLHWHTPSSGQPMSRLPAVLALPQMYCTGGIRCDVYSTFLRQKGFNNLYTLEGGVQNYLRQAGSEHWNGSLFVFDGRMALPADNPGERRALSAVA